MRPVVLLRLLLATPFRPFRLYVLESTVYEVRHPEMAILSLSTITVHTQQGNLPLPLGVEKVIVALRHITRIEVLSPPKAVGSNGG